MAYEMRFYQRHQNNKNYMNNGNLPINPCNYPNYDSGNIELTPGLTKREYFTAMAMQGLMTEFEQDGHELTHADNVARKAVRMADAILKQLES